MHVFHLEGDLPLTSDLKIKFFNKIMKTESCWIWSGAKTVHGYGVMRVEPIKNVFVRAHRFSYQLHNGTIPEGMKVLHSCDNPSCVNPSHLFLGTSFDNTQDMIAKGRDNFARLPKHL